MEWVACVVALYTTLTFAALNRYEEITFPETRAGEYLFVLNKNTSVIAKQEFEASLSITPTKIFSIGKDFHCYFFKQINSTVMSEIASLPAVSYVEPNRIMKATTIQKNPPSWGLKRIWNRNLPLLNEYVYSDKAGVGVDVYIIDSGIYTQHNDLPNSVWGKTFNHDGGDADCNGHGTHLAGIVGGTKYGVAKFSTLIAVKVLDCYGSGYLDQIVNGIEWVVSQHFSKSKNGKAANSVANLALGGDKTKALDDAVDAAVNTGVHFSISAGNNMGNACSYSPSDSKLGIKVAAADIYDLPASFSNGGTCVTLWAPGTDITSATIGSKDAEEEMSGTSVSAPHVAGVIALYLADSTSTITPSAMKSLLESRATKDIIDYGALGTPSHFFRNSSTAGCTKDSDCSSSYKCCPKFGGTCIRSSLVCCGTGSCKTGEACCDEKDWVWGCCFVGMECHNDRCRNSHFWTTPNLNLYSNPP